MRRFLAVFLLLIPILLPAQTMLWAKKNRTAELDLTINAYGVFADKATPQFLLQDLRLGVEGTEGVSLDYKVQVDLANLVYHPKVNPLLDAKVDIDLPKQFNVIAGYQSLPFSLNSIVGFRQSPFFQRTTLADGNLFVRRDMGVTVRKKALKNRFNGFFGFYGGTGRVNPFYKNSGYTVLGRAAVSFPASLRYDEIDIRQSPLPRFSMGVNALYTRQHTDSVVFGLPFWVNGQKWVGGIDAVFAYRGLSLQGEWNYAQVNPAENTTGYQKSYRVTGGFCSGNYFIRPIRTTLALRYEAYTVNQPNTDRVSASRLAISYFFDKSHRRVFRLDYCFQSTYQEENLQSGLGKGVRMGVQLGL